MSAEKKHGTNPTGKPFVSYEAAEPVIAGDYSKLNIEVREYVTMENFAGEQQTYSLDVLTAKKPEKAAESTAASSTADTAAQSADSAAENCGKHPAVIFLHGGGHNNRCDRHQGYVPMFATFLSRFGVVVFAPDYPVFNSPEEREAAGGGRMAGCTKTAEAIHYCYRFVQENAERYHIDPSRIAIMGGSAGGWTAFHAIADYPEDHYVLFTNCWGTPEDEVELKHFPPTLSIHGTADQLVSYDLEAPIQEELARYGIPHELVTLEGARHTPLSEFPQYEAKLAEFVMTYLL